VTRVLHPLALALLLPAAASGQTAGVEIADLGGLEARSAALILSGQEAGDLDAAVLAVPMPAPAGDPSARRVVLVVDVGGKSLLAGAEDDSLVAEVYAYAVDGFGGLGGVLTQAFRIDLARHRQRLAETGVKFLGHLDLMPGDYSLRVLVLHRKSGRLRLEVEDLTVRPLQDTEILPPLFPEPADRWIVVREKGDDELPFPRLTDGRSWVPATRPSTAGEASFYLAGRGLSGGLRAHVVDDRGGEVLSELGLGDLRPVDEAPAGLEMVAAEVRTAGLGGGRHRLQVSSADGTASASIALRLPDSPSQRLVEDELAEPPIGAAPGSRKLGSVPRGRALVELLDRTHAAYLAALGHLGASDTPKALTAIIELERAGIGTVLTDATPKIQEQLRGTQVTVVARLVGARVEGLVALISLHEQLYRQYYEHRHYFLAGHTREVMKALVDLYVLRSRSPEAAHLAASAVASLGGFLLELGARPAAIEVYEQALDYDPGDSTSLLALAMIYEAASDYEAAAGRLRKLVAEDPTDRRARLHLAVNSRRLGEKKRALEALEGCIADEPANWMTALAYQELAKLHVDDKHPKDAVAVLEAALDRMPDEQALYLQLAALLDRIGAPARATAVLRRLDARAAGGPPSPRLLYSQPPTSHIVHSRLVLEDAVASRMPELMQEIRHFAAVDETGDAASAGPGRP
jgi:tetratricopeptide (TPR) repeat protein